MHAMQLAACARQTAILSSPTHDVLVNMSDSSVDRATCVASWRTEAYTRSRETCLRASRSGHAFDICTYTHTSGRLSSPSFAVILVVMRFRPPTTPSSPVTRDKMQQTVPPPPIRYDQVNDANELGARAISKCMYVSLPT